MKREREGGGNSPGRGGVGGPLQPGQSIPDARLRSQRRRLAKEQRQRLALAAKVTPTGETNLGETNFGGPEVQGIVARLTFILCVVTYCATP